MLYSYRESTKLPNDLKNKVQTISCASQTVTEDKAEIMTIINAVSVFNQVTSDDMAEEEWKNMILEIVHQYVRAQEKIKKISHCQN